MNEPFADGPVIKGFDPYVVQDAIGFGAKRVNKFDVIEPAIFPVQFPVLLSEYVALRFIKRPDEAGTGIGVAILWTLRVDIFARGETRDVRFDVPETFREVPNIEDAFRVVALVVETFRDVTNIEDALRVVTLVVERFDVPVTFRDPPKIEAPFKVVTLVVAKFDVPETFRDPPKIEAPFKVVTLVVAKFDTPETFRDDTLRVVMFAPPETLRDVPKIEAPFKVVTLVVAKLEMPVTLRRDPPSLNTLLS